MPQEVRERLNRSIQPVLLSKGQVLYESERPISAVYFPTRCLISLLQTEDDHPPIEVGMVGNEGVVGLAQYFGLHETPAGLCAVVQIPGEAWQVDAEVFLAELIHRPVDTLLKRYLGARGVELTRNIVCARWHPLPQRFARRLLDIHDRVHMDTFPLPQQAFSEMLGVHRQQVGRAAIRFRQQGFIAYRHGQMTIVDRVALENLACTCYSIVRDALARPPTTPGPSEPLNRRELSARQQSRRQQLAEQHAAAQLLVTELLREGIATEAGQRRLLDLVARLTEQVLEMRLAMLTLVRMQGG